MPYRRTDITTLKGAFAALIDRVGGLKRAATVSRVGEPALSRYCAEFEDRRFAPIDVVASLETDCGAAIVTAFLAGMQDMVLTPQAKGAGDQARDFAAVTRDAASSFADYAAMLDDGCLGALQRQSIVRHLDALIADAGRLRADMIGAQPAASGSAERGSRPFTFSAVRGS